MSYIVPRDKPNKCTNCPFMDRITYDCKLMYGDDYPDFEAQYNHCPLIEIPNSHGRLGDLDEPYKVANMADDFGADILDMLKLIADTPTVIEEEGSET